MSIANVTFTSGNLDLKHSFTQHAWDNWGKLVMLVLKPDLLLPPVETAP